MAVQQLAKNQAIKEKKKQEEQDMRDEENALDDTQRYMDLMDRIYKKPKNPIGLSPKQKGPGGPVLEAKKGTLVKKGGQCRGVGIAIRGKNFKGVF